MQRKKRAPGGLESGRCPFTGHVRAGTLVQRLNVRRFIFSSLTALAIAAAVPALADPTPVKKGAAKVKTGIHWTVAPDTVEIFVDGKRVGTAKSLDVTTTKPGMHAVKLVNGEDETEFDVMVKKGQIVELRYEFTDI